jgi:hypothetical protein
MDCFEALPAARRANQFVCGFCLSSPACKKHFAFGVGLDPGIRRRQAQKFSSHRLGAHSLIS